MKIIDITPANALEETFFCIKNVRSQGFKDKKVWFEKRYGDGLRLKILKDNSGKPIAFIEYIPGAKAWRPVHADHHMFIHCMFVYSKKDRQHGLASMLVKHCEEDARAQGLSGISVMTSDGSWITDKRLFLKNGFEQVDQLGRFELLSKSHSKESDMPKLIDWTKQQAKYKGWNLIYADQCPWHEKAVNVLKNVSVECGIELNIDRLNSVSEAKNAPSGFGVFSLIKDGKLLTDHYISESSFRKFIKLESN